MWAFEGKGINDGYERKNAGSLQNANGLPGMTKEAAGRFLIGAEGFFITGTFNFSASCSVLEMVATKFRRL